MNWNNFDVKKIRAKQIFALPSFCR